MYQLIYVSKSVRLIKEEELLELLRKSRFNNQMRNVTGMLLYIDNKVVNNKVGRFMQVLEGEKSDVEYIYEKILANALHHNITVINQGRSSGRYFNSWSMGFAHVNSQFESGIGTFHLDDSFLELDNEQPMNGALTYLKSFYTLKNSMLK